MTPDDMTDWQIYDEDGQRKYLSAAEFAGFLAAADCYAPRQRALVYVLAFAGCRISEALALTPHQLDADRMALTFKTLKRRRVSYRTVPMPPEVIDMLRQLPPAEDGRFWPVHRVTAWRWIKDVMQRADIAGPMACPKGLRHSFGVRAASRDIPLTAIQKWLGHASQKTTAIYMDVVGPEERALASRMWTIGQQVKGNAAVPGPTHAMRTFRREPPRIRSKPHDFFERMGDAAIWNLVKTAVENEFARRAS